MTVSTIMLRHLFWSVSVMVALIHFCLVALEFGWNLKEIMIYDPNEVKCFEQSKGWEYLVCG